MLPDVRVRLWPFVDGASNPDHRDAGGSVLDPFVAGVPHRVMVELVASIAVHTAMEGAPLHPDLQRALFCGCIDLPLAVECADADAVVVAGQARRKVVPPVVKRVGLHR